MDNTKPKRVSILVVNGNEFVLIFRHKNGQDYYAVPGGKIEDGETPNDAAIREIKEELGFDLTNIEFISEEKTDTRHDFNFTANTKDSEFIVTGPEKNHLSDPNDLFKPLWLNKNTIDSKLPIYPTTSRDVINNYLSK